MKEGVAASRSAREYIGPIVIEANTRLVARANNPGNGELEWD